VLCEGLAGCSHKLRGRARPETPEEWKKRRNVPKERHRMAEATLHIFRGTKEGGTYHE
jgi:hypothetical protein